MGVSISAYISSWNHSLRSYVGYEAADRSTSKVASLNVCTRRSSVVEPRPWNSADRHPFDIMRFVADLEEEVYCAAFLACRLCVFVLPDEHLDLICASVFKVASFMANGSRHTTTNRSVSPQMMRYHDRGKGKVYALNEARYLLRSCLVTWKATRPDRGQPFFYDGHARESPECLAIEVAESCPPALPTLTIAQGATVILRTRISSLWSYIFTGIEGKSSEMVVKKEESALKTFEVLTQMGLGNYPDLHDKLQGFFQKEREMDAASLVTSPDSTSEEL
ncbi:hypothetical protein LIER_15184 [Lithospermum erythrorhizon]|uniref:Uncharacterized protein n=1 Tax=Lithospermum erythrorhizon TaxID=34254 RepID=A0AAV3Q3E1_LITER